MSVHIRSFLRDENESFTPIEDWSGGVEDPDYTEGAVELTINDTPVITMEDWDYIVQLWSGILNTLKDLTRENASRSYFPDQPIIFEMKRVGRGSIEVSLSAKHPDLHISATADEQILALKLIEQGEHFFSTMIQINPEDRPLYERQLKTFGGLRKIYY